ncbi:unnamed protein product [marine sediment metagenome]|uniref:Uncharacterized protein n=1 Tax=marine sediment metagenome TaxID=412755 RepID=X1UYV5_9ZZZZ
MSNKIQKPYIYGETLELLKQLPRDGYVYTGKNRNRLRYLQKIFPVIRRSQFKNKSIYYLEDKNKLALKEMMKQNSSRIINYQELRRACQVFNADILKTEKKQFFGKNKPRSRRRNHKSKPDCSSVSKEKQTLLDDFFGRFLHSEVLQCSSSKSPYQRLKNDDRDIVKPDNKQGID